MEQKIYRVCHNCKGTGDFKNKTCKDCDGEGRVLFGFLVDEDKPKAKKA
jgi:DnaJ-class molecular chaperone